MSELLYQTLRESVVNAIRTKIMNHQIRPGERIVEMELAHEFQTGANQGGTASAGKRRNRRVYQKCRMFRADIFFLGFL